MMEWYWMMMAALGPMVIITAACLISERVQHARKKKPDTSSDPAPSSVCSYHEVKNGNWRIPKSGEGYGHWHTEFALLMDIRGALWEVRDAVNTNTAYMKQVYGDPKSDE